MLKLDVAAHITTAAWKGYKFDVLDELERRQLIYQIPGCKSFFLGGKDLTFCWFLCIELPWKVILITDGPLKLCMQPGGLTVVRYSSNPWLLRTIGFLKEVRMGFFDKLLGTAKIPIKRQKPLSKISAGDREELGAYVARLEHIFAREQHFLGPAKEASRMIGSEINQTYSFAGMVYVCDSIRSRLGATAGRELEAAWDLIGEWMG